MRKNENTGCYLCKHLEWYEADWDEIAISGWYCDHNERSEDFKTFPCVSKLSCRELRKELPNDNN